jgi:hypothetical protein
MSQPLLSQEVVMKSPAAAILGLLFLVGPGWAQEKTAGASPVTLGPQAHTGGETCVEVEIGGEKTPTLNCLNQQLRRAVENVQPTGNIAPLGASSPAPALGEFNETAMSEQYGQNWGKSAVPYRPPPPVYGSPVRLH